MKTKGRWQWVAVAGLGMALAGATGCQTNVAGMTLPSERYLQHPPQFIPSDPVFPLSRELAIMQAGRPGALGGGAALGLPQQVPGGLPPGAAPFGGGFPPGAGAAPFGGGIMP
jgi:hypothetical protein